MRKIIILSALTLLFFSCKKESKDFVWEKTFGKGTAFFVRSSADSGIVSCGEAEGSPYLLKLSKTREVTAEFRYTGNGLFSSVWSDTSRFIAAGSSNGKILLSCISRKGNMIWDTTLNTSFRIDIANLSYSGLGEFLVLGSAKPDSAVAGQSGLLFVRFDTSGKIIEKKEITDANFLAAGKMAVNSQGNIFLPLTRKTAYAKAKASVAMFNSFFQKIWETELYNNPDFGAAAFSVLTDNSADIYATGKTEVTRESGVLDNAFLTSLTRTGTVRWKKYLEINNSGRAILMDNNVLMLLSRNCFIINQAEHSDGADAGIIRVFNSCESDKTDAFGHDFDINFNGDILLAGSKGGNFYLALKSLPQ